MNIISGTKIGDNLRRHQADEAILRHAYGMVEPPFIVRQNDEDDFCRKGDEDHRSAVVALTTYYLLSTSICFCNLRARSRVKF